MWEHVGIGKKKLRQSDPCGIFSQTGTQSLSALTLTRTYTNLKYHDCGWSVLRDLYLISLPRWPKSSHLVLLCCSHPFYFSLLLSVSCYRVFSSGSLALFIFYCNADSLPPLVPQFVSLTLILNCCSVKIDFNIHEQSFLFLSSFLLSIYVDASEGIFLSSFFFYSPSWVWRTVAAHQCHN